MKYNIHVNIYSVIETRSCFTQRACKIIFNLSTNTFITSSLLVTFPWFIQKTGLISFPMVLLLNVSIFKTSSYVEVIMYSSNLKIMISICETMYNLKSL